GPSARNWLGEPAPRARTTAAPARCGARRPRLRVMSARGDRLKHWGWGRESQAPDRAAVEAMAPLVRERLGLEPQPVEEPLPLEAIELPEPRIAPPAGLAELFTADRYERVSRSLGKAYRDVVRGLRGEIEHAPDLVALPRSEEEVER